MADDVKKRGPQDKSRVNINEAWEVKYWAQKFGVTQEQLKHAARKVGPKVDAIRTQLKG